MTGDPVFSLLAALVAFAVLVLLLLTVRKAFALLVNSALGLALLFAANALFSMGIAYTWLAVLVCAIGGIPGALLLVGLHLLDISV